MKRSAPLLAIGALFFLAMPVRADIVYEFASATFHGNKGHSQAYTVDGYTIGTHGFNSALSNSNQTLTLGSKTDLYAKYSGVGSDETGLGIASDPSGDHEITTKSTIAIDFQSIPYSALVFTIGSVQKGESFAVFGGETGPTNFLGSVSGNTNSTAKYTFDVTAAQDQANHGIFYITATDNNVLLDSVSVGAAVPEPSSIVLILTSVSMIGGFGWLRKFKTA